MKKTFLLLTVFALGFLAVQAQEPASQPVNKNAPVMTFDESLVSNGKIVYDYGTIEKGGNGSSYFAFQNSGKEPLIITNTRSSCGCTVPSPPKYPILPGQFDTIWVKYNTKKMGAINKTITVTSNAKNSPIVLRIKGKVILPESHALPEKKLEAGSPVSH